MSREHAVVIGASSDIGCAVCALLSRAGFAITGTYRDEDRAKLVTAACATEPSLVRFDVRDRDVDGLVARVGGDPVTAVVYAVGELDPPGLSDEDWDRVLDVNVSGAFRTVRALAPLMTEGGAIAFVGSTAHRQAAGPAAYVASKAALRALGKALARELARRKVRVNTVEPSFVDTRFEGEERAELRRRQLGAMIPLGRLATPEEVAEAVRVALTNPYLTGATLTVAGGAVMD